MSDSSESFFRFLRRIQNVNPKTLVEEVQDLKKLGNAEFSKENYDVAIIYYTQAISMCPESEQAILSVLFQNRAVTYSKLNNNENCLADCNEALALVPTYQKALSRRARVHSELGNFKLALEDITALQILDKSKNQGDLIFADSVKKSLAKQNLEEYTKHDAFHLPSKIIIDNYMKSICDNLLSDKFTMTLLKPEINTGLEYALKCIQDQKYEEIEISCQEEINKTDNSLIRISLALNILAAFCFMRGKFAAGIEHLTTVIENPNVPNKMIIYALIKRASIYQELEEVDKSLEDFKRAEAIDPNSSLVYHHRAQTYLTENKIEKAVEEFKKAVELNPECILSIIYCYFAQFRHAKRDSSELDVEEFLRKLKGFVIKYPDFAEGYERYGQALTENGDYVEADLLYEKAHEIFPDNATFLIKRAMLSLEKNKLDAIHFLEHALNVDPNNDFAGRVLGILYMKFGKLKKAIDCFEKAILPCKSEKDLLHIFSLRNSAQAQLAASERLEITPP